MEKYQNSIDRTRFYDPDIVGIVVQVLSGLGSASAVVAAAIEIVRLRKEKLKDRQENYDQVARQESVASRLRHTLNEMDFSLHQVRQHLETLRKIHYAAETRYTRENEIESERARFPMRFGDGNLSLRASEFIDFNHARTQIANHLESISSSLTLLEMLLVSEYDKDLTDDIGGNRASLHYVREAVRPVNRTMMNFGRTSIDAFIADTEYVCHHTQTLIDTLYEHIVQLSDDVSE